jgi:DnaJ homolog subfamily C member 22
MAKSLLLTYIIWFFGGIFGLHHFYLNRDRHAFVMWMSFGGYFGCGWIRDLWRIPEYVKDANEDPEYLTKLVGLMKKHPKPPTGFVRHAATIIVADILGYLVIGAIPVEILPYGNVLLPYLCALLAPLAVAIGMYYQGRH